MGEKLNLWDVLAWIVLFGIVIWIILKMLGIINTPILIEYVPYFGIAYLLGWNIHKLEYISSRVESFEKFKDVAIKEIHLLKETCIKKHG